jgi:hypothetical protein
MQAAMIIEMMRVTDPPPDYALSSNTTITGLTASTTGLFFAVDNGDASLHTLCN